MHINSFFLYSCIGIKTTLCLQPRDTLLLGKRLLLVICSLSSHAIMMHLSSYICFQSCLQFQYLMPSFSRCRCQMRGCKKQLVRFWKQINKLVLYDPFKWIYIHMYMQLEVMKHNITCNRTDLYYHTHFGIVDTTIFSRIHRFALMSLACLWEINDHSKDISTDNPFNNFQYLMSFLKRNNIVWHYFEYLM